MNIIIESYENTQAMQTRAEALRAGGHSDIIIMTKKAGGNIGIVVSHEFDDRCINMEHCSEIGAQVVRSDVPYGAYGNLLSIPGNTFVMHVPLSNEGVTLMKFIDAISGVYSGVGDVQLSGNDFTLNEKKLMGIAAYPGQLVAIGSLFGFGSEIDNIYTDYFREHSGKVLPSQRVIGYNTLAADAVDIRGFAELIRGAFNRLTDVYIDAVIEVDADVV